ncbi:hypothetical protein [Bradyrhizobium erythrophlei]|nr:hypothetical protein [Bradyrhizobium erythrophlei]
MFDDGKPLSEREAWLWLISNAAWRPMQILVRNGRAAEMLNLDRGQLSFSRSFLQKAWRWTSEKRVRTFLNRLERESMVDLLTGQLQTVISICNYGVFQNGGALTGPANGPAMGQQRAGNGPEEENIINIKNKILPPPSPPGFDEWYAIYPRKKAPQAAKKAFAKALASGLIALPVLMERTRAFAATWANEPKDRRKFIPYPASWLNAGGYDDEPEGGGEPAPAPINPRTFDDDGWRRRLKYFQDADKWLDEWGAKPGEPGCLVPPHLILTPVSNSKGAA